MRESFVCKTDPRFLLEREELRANYSLHPLFSFFPVCVWFVVVFKHHFVHSNHYFSSPICRSSQNQVLTTLELQWGNRRGWGWRGYYRLELTEKLHCGLDFEIAYLRSFADLSTSKLRKSGD